MVDPLSIIGLLGTAATLTKTVLDYACAVKNAPKEVDNLSRELTSLHGVFDLLVDVVEDEDNKQDFAEISTLYNAAGVYIFTENEGILVVLTQQTQDLVITLESLRMKLDEFSTAKGLRKAYDRMKWPIDRPDTQKVLQIIQRYTQMFQFALTIKGSKALSQVSGKATEMLSASKKLAQTQSEILSAIASIPEHQKIMDELKKLHLNVKDDRHASEDQEFFRVLSSLEFSAKQKEAYSKRHSTTGKWLLDTQNFKDWSGQENDQSAVLWCPGNPGVGKTVLTSIAVNYVSEIARDSSTAIIYLYCDYANPLTHSVKALMGSMIRQLVEQTPHTETVAQIKQLYEQNSKSRDLTADELFKGICTVSKDFDLVYAFFDALDECPEISRNLLLPWLQRYSENNARVFLTSRPNVDVKFSIPGAVRIDIAASAADITAYLESEIQKNARLSRFTARDPDLKSTIVKGIVDKADGMFLIASLQIDSLCKQTSPKQIKTLLSTLPADVFATYDNAFHRIQDQPREDADLGMKVLSLMFGATRPLGVEELRHALAVEPAATGLDTEALTDLEIILGVTAGLITTFKLKIGRSRECLFVRFVHNTLQEYLEINQAQIFPNVQRLIAETCLTYLSYDKIGSDEPSPSDVPNSRAEFLPFAEYAVRNWGVHLRRVQQELMRQALAFIQDRKKILTWIEMYGAHFCLLVDLSSDDHSSIGVHVAAFWGLTDLLTVLITPENIESRNIHGQTPLFHAANEGYDDVLKLLIGRKANVNARDARSGRTALCKAVERGHHTIIITLLEHGADINTQTSSGTTPLHRVAGKKLDTVRLLLERGARVDIVSGKHGTALHEAARIGTGALVRILLDHGTPLDMPDTLGSTPLHLAAERASDSEETLLALLRGGARLDSRDRMGRTPLHLAVDANHRGDQVKVLLQEEQRRRSDELSLRQSRSIDLPNHGPTSSSHSDSSIIQTGTSVNAQDSRGRTPLHYAYYRVSRGSYLQVDSIQGDDKVRARETVGLLLKSGASDSIVDVVGKIPSQYANLSVEDARRWKQDYSFGVSFKSAAGRLKNNQAEDIQNLSRCIDLR